MKFKEALNSIGNGCKKANGTKSEIKDLPIDDLDAMLDYQRDINEDYVNYIIEHFDEKEVSTVLVSARPDGTMKVCDGQHTVAVLKKLGYTVVRCEVRYGLSEQEENDWFYRENSKRQPQARKRTLTAQINGTYEKNKSEQDFNNCIKSLGFKLDIYGESSGTMFRIGCPVKLLSVYNEYSSIGKIENFTECMDIIKSCFHGNPVSLQWSFLKGMFDFYETYSNEFDRKRFISTMGKLDPKDIKSRTDADMYTKKPSLKYAKLFVNEYNCGLSKAKKLKMSKLED